MMADATRPPLGIGTLIALGLALAVLIGLGTWQLQRKHWKEALLADIALRSQGNPVKTLLPGEPRFEFSRVEVLGSFVAGTERHVFISVPRQPNGIGGPGYWVFQQFETQGRRIYVNRGFVPEAEKARDFGAPQNVVIRGVHRLPEARVRFSNPNNAAKNVYYVRSPSEFDANAGNGLVQPRLPATRADSYLDLLDQRQPPSADVLPMPLVGKISIPNRHLEYALTWYALAATLAAIAFARFRRTV